MVLVTAEIGINHNGDDDLRIAVLGSHSALEIMDGAKDEGLDTIVFCQKGRDRKSVV